VKDFIVEERVNEFLDRKYSLYCRAKTEILRVKFNFTCRPPKKRLQHGEKINKKMRIYSEKQTKT